MKRTPLKRTAKMKATSDRRGKQQRERRKLGQHHLEPGEPCWLAIPGVCTGPAEAWHELVGSGMGGGRGSRVDPRNLCAACNACNSYLEGADERFVRRWKVRSSDAMPGIGGLVPRLLHPLSLAARLGGNAA